MLRAESKTSNEQTVTPRTIKQSDPEWERERHLVLSLLLVVRDVEELDLVALLGGGDDTEPVTELLLAEVLLGQVLEVALGEGDVGVDPDLALTCNAVEKWRKMFEKRKGRYRGRESLSQLSPTRVRDATL